MGDDRVAVFGATLEGAGKLREDAPFLRVPAEHGLEVDGFMAKIVVLGMDAKKRQSAQEQEGCFPLGAAESVAFLAAEPDVEPVICFARPEIELVAREDPQSSDARIGGEKFRQLQGGGPRKSRGALQ